MMVPPGLDGTLQARTTWLFPGVGVRLTVLVDPLEPTALTVVTW
ncbi:unannotated protein [freshwater metagenome]|uniref:Unannotated protein n=1 Tax=freshwater metagenome TaxID=449393 RepID=A0A6J6UBW0_9ZZZZ